MRFIQGNMPFCVGILSRLILIPSVTSMARPPQDQMMGVPISNQEMAAIYQNEH